MLSVGSIFASRGSASAAAFSGPRTDASAAATEGTRVPPRPPSRAEGSFAGLGLTSDSGGIAAWYSAPSRI